VPITLNKQKAYALLCIGFLLLYGCSEKRRDIIVSSTQSPTPPMASTFPFEVSKEEDVDAQMANRQYWIQCPVGEIDGYHELFEEYGFGGNGPSWVEHISAILEEKDPQILGHLEFDEEGDTFLAYADSEEIVNRFMKVVQPVFADKKSLKQYLSKADPDNFSE
jgi:hypothetical protein